MHVRVYSQPIVILNNYEDADKLMSQAKCSSRLQAVMLNDLCGGIYFCPCHSSYFEKAWGLTGVSHRCHMVQNGDSAVNSCMNSSTNAKSNTMQPNSRRAPKSYYENYWMYLVTSLYMCDGRSSTTNFVANALMTPGGRADSL